MSPSASQLLRTATKGMALAADRVRPPTRGITILIYHRVGLGSGGQMDLDPAAFDEQLAWLAANRRVISLDTALDELAGDGVEDGVVITFDDGTTDWVDVVAPALTRHGLPATFYVATGFVEDGIEFPHGGRPISWDGLAELASSDLVTVGSHTHRHRLLDRLAPAEIGDELDRASELLGERLGISADHFCYPKALPPSPEADRMVRQRFRSAVLAGTRSNGPGADPYTLSRSPVQASDGPRWFRAKADGGLGAEDSLRRGINRLRYRGAER